jgi:hypothetical protein
LAGFDLTRATPVARFIRTERHHRAVVPAHNVAVILAAPIGLDLLF